MDVDIDFQTSFDLNSVIKHAIPASTVKKGMLAKHNCGYYLQNIPVDEHTGFAAIPFEEAEVMGYFKIDFLHLSLLDNIKSKAELRSMIATEPNWDLLQDPKVVEKLFQVHRNADLLQKVKPRTVQQLADVCSLIRPGKVYLINRYLQDPDKARDELYKRPDKGYYFKRSHAICYALTIVAQLHMIARGTI